MTPAAPDVPQEAATPETAPPPIQAPNPLRSSSRTRFFFTLSSHRLTRDTAAV